MKITLKQPYSFKQQGKRDYQEDARFPDADKPDSKQRFFVICDGVGGSKHGEVASNLVCQAFKKKMSAFNLKRDFTNDDFQHVLDFAYDMLDEKGKDMDGDMATTLIFICFHVEGVTMAHIGDSKIYQIRKNDGILYRSDDHSLVNNLVHNGLISPEEGIDHPRKNVIMRCMSPVQVQYNRGIATVYRTTDVKPDDFFFLCSDGVLQDFDDDEIVEWITADADNSEKMQRLADKSKDNSDNNTAFLLQVESVDDAPEEDDADNGPNEEPQGLKEAGESTTKPLRSRSELTDIESVRQQKEKDSNLFNKLKHIFNKN